MGKKLIIQNHHLQYAVPEHKQKEIVVRIYKGEHFLLSQLHRRTNISKGFIKDIDVWLALNRDKAMDL